MCEGGRTVGAHCEGSTASNPNPTLACVVPRARVTVSIPVTTIPTVWFHVGPGAGSQTVADDLLQLPSVGAATDKVDGKSCIGGPFSFSFPSHHVRRRLPASSAIGRLRGVM